MKKEFIITVLCFVIVLFGGLLALEARAATLAVTKTADTNDSVCNADCSLREAIVAAGSGDTIEFASPLFDTRQLITLALGELYSNKTLTINGRSAALTVIYGNDQSRVFDNGGILTLNRITITGGKDFGGSGIYNDAGSTLTLTDSVVSGNRLFGGAVVVYRGAGIFNAANSTVTITGSTISNNTGNGSREYEGIGIANLGNNLINNSNPGLVPLGNYGGATPTHALLLISPALNAGDNCALAANICGIAHPALPDDQRAAQDRHKY
jgi:CSLREA domain-containing protein